MTLTRVSPVIRVSTTSTGSTPSAGRRQNWRFGPAADSHVLFPGSGVGWRKCPPTSPKKSRPSISGRWSPSEAPPGSGGSEKQHYTPALNKDSILQVRDLVTSFETDAGRVTAVDRVSFDVPRGKTLGIVGESGCGKSVTAMSIMRLLPKPSGQILGGRVYFEGEDLLSLNARQMRQVRGAKISMIFQEPMTALNPVHRVGRQLSEVFLLHTKMSQEEAWEASIDMLRKVGIPSPELRVGEYPHQLSGGMRQRVVIAMALALKPSLVIADEPTTALDVTIQAQILELIKSLQKEMGMSVILITHDLGVIAETCDNVVVMYAGRVAELGTIHDIFEDPQHLYTKGLLDSIPRIDSERKTRLATIPGMVPGLQELPVGARFAPRSPHPGAKAYLESREYREVRPELIEVKPGHWVEDCEVVRRTNGR
ncbi:MAG: ABC transporter ATP-binding protein [Puniceicoccaceae bacterium]|nr:MAG: ABC transporter ATP-binding protein [Puniceicoccaceae bacterium]